MKSRAFRSLIRSALVGSLPLIGAHAGCDTCYDNNTSDIPASAMMQIRVLQQSCASICGTTTSTCTVLVQGQTSFAVQCSGESMTRDVTDTLIAPVDAVDCHMLCEDSSTQCSVEHIAATPTPKNIRHCFSSHLCAAKFPPTTSVEGRRPAEMVRGQDRSRSELGAFFAEVMQLEAASVDAFDILAAELVAHGAPAFLIAAAERARADEVRHTRMAAALMQRFGGESEPPQVLRHPVRSLREIALENAVEGCVREAFGAFQASWQASAAADSVVRAVMKRVARDEIEHAELSFAIAAWAESRLSPDERAELATTRTAAIETLLSELANGPSETLQRVAGLPPVAASQAFVRAHARLN